MEGVGNFLGFSRPYSHLLTAENISGNQLFNAAVSHQRSEASFHLLAFRSFIFFNLLSGASFHLLAFKSFIFFCFQELHFFYLLLGASLYLLSGASFVVFLNLSKLNRGYLHEQTGTLDNKRMRRKNQSALDHEVCPRRKKY